MSRAFKQRLLQGQALHGLFCCSYSVQVVEALSGSGLDFLLFDLEHTPNALPPLHAQLCALAASDTAAIVRVPQTELAGFKLLLDLGVAGLMVPNVHSAEQAAEAVSFTRYPPHGVRGIAGSVRAAGYGRDGSYLQTAGERTSLIVQVESTRAVADLERIAAVDGVDAVFVGPNDLAADMGLLGQPGHPEVVQVVEQCLRRIRQAGKPAGVLCAEADRPRYQAVGASLFALGSDLGLLVKTADALAQRQRANPA